MNALEQLIAERQGLVRVAPLPTPVGVTGLGLLLERTGLTEAQLAEQIQEADAAVPMRSRPNEVPMTAELRRVAYLPRRARPSNDQLQTWVEGYTAALRLPGGMQTLRPLQAWALHELRLAGGLFGALAVGKGKTLISWLAIVVSGAKRPLVIVPASLRRKTRDDFRELAKHWVGPHPDSVRVESYEYVSQSGAATLGKDTHGKPVVLEQEFLFRYAPDLLVLDEVQKIARPHTAVTRRFKRYMTEFPGTRCVALSGTITKRSLKDYAHILEWCLPQSCPVPVEWEIVGEHGRHETLGLWADALDEKVPDLRRLRPGALLQLASEADQRLASYGEDVALQIARRAFRDRLAETVGCVISTDSDVTHPKTGAKILLSLREWAPVERDASLEPHFRLLREKGTLPDGKVLTDQLSSYAASRQLGLGFYYSWWDQRAWIDSIMAELEHHRGQDRQVLGTAAGLTKMDPWLVYVLSRLQKEAEWRALGMVVDAAEPLPGPWGGLLRACPGAAPALIRAAIAARPPEAWVNARKEWGLVCRHVWKTNKRNLDTEAQIATAVEQGLYPGGEFLAKWRELRPTYEPVTEAVWLSFEALQAAQRWAELGPGLIWVEHVEFATELAARTGLEYYGREGLNAAGTPLEQHNPAVPCIVGIRANQAGRNLQAWNRNLVMCPPSDGGTWEQMQGRTHRSGQERDVTCDVWLGCFEHGVGFWQATRDAQYVHDTTGSEQKLCTAQIELPDIGQIQHRGGFRWRK